MPRRFQQPTTTEGRGLLSLQTELRRVIMKRLPNVEVHERNVDDAGIPCDCIDGLFNEPNPDCIYCYGTGLLRIDLPPETIEIKTGHKKVWLTEARIIVDAAEAIYDEEEDIVISDIHAFFNPTEDVQINDYIIPEGSKQVFVVKSVQQVRSLDNVLFIDCALEEQST